jgi:predicted glycogen debranching enzyme
MAESNGAAPPVTPVAFLGPDALQDLDRAAGCEWLLCDGLGGYASSTPIGLHTRRYHGLLVAATRPPLGRMVLLSRVDEAVLVGGRRQELSTSAYKGAIHPRGFESALAFSLDPLPTLTWQVEGGRLTRTIARIHGTPGTAVVYAYDGAAPATLELRPLLAFRHHHALQREHELVDAQGRLDGPDVVLKPSPDCPELRLRVPEGTFVPDACWYRGVVYERERERGYDFEEDLFSPGRFVIQLYAGEVATLLAWAGGIPQGAEAVALQAVERERLNAAGGGGQLLGRLRRAADAFLVRRGVSGRGVIAGYPWFSEWGRDAMVALPGLCLATGRLPEAREILSEYARRLEAGLLPSRYPEADGVEYDSCDTALWFVLAVQRYLEAGGDRAFVRASLQQTVFAILDACRRGTRYGIRMTPAGLLTQGGHGLALTWMDARQDGLGVTPRAGEAVEVQALWYNALRLAAELAQRAGDRRRSGEWLRLARLAHAGFQDRFWSETLGYLADVVGEGGADFSLRPNQLFAIGLPHALLPRDKAVRVLEAVGRELLTPVGLRSLAPGDPAYRGRYHGNVAARDAAYHQGTVWPWLMGVYFDALTSVHGEQGTSAAREWLRGFEGHLGEAGLGYVSEVFDGDPPHRPGGAIAQAWSVAELLRIASRVG